MRTGDGRMLPERLKEELVREHERLCLAHKQVAALEAQSKAELRAAAPGSVAAKIMQLIDLKSIGGDQRAEAGQRGVLRSFDNRRQVGSYFGLTGTPYDSGESPPRAGHQQGRQQPCPRPRNRA